MLRGTPTTSGLTLLGWLLFLLPATAQTGNPPSGSLAPLGSYSVLTKDAIVGHLQQYSGSNHEREQRIKAWFLQAGCPASELVEQTVTPGIAPNLICTIRGETDSVILVSAHFDYVDRGAGVADNWSGASLLSAFAYTLANVPRHHTFVLVSFTEEEKHLVGSDFYAKHLPPDQRARIAAVINLDTLGLAPTEVWASHSNSQLASVLIALAEALKMPVSGVNVDRLGTTDSESFARYDIPRITIHSLTQATIPVLHSARDQFSAIHLDDYYTTYRLLSAYLIELDSYLNAKSEQKSPATANHQGTPPTAPSN